MKYKVVRTLRSLSHYPPCSIKVVLTLQYSIYYIQTTCHIPMHFTSLCTLVCKLRSSTKCFFYVGNHKIQFLLVQRLVRLSRKQLFESRFFMFSSRWKLGLFFLLYTSFQLRLRSYGLVIITMCLRKLTTRTVGCTKTVLQKQLQQHIAFAMIRKVLLQQFLRLMRRTKHTLQFNIKLHILRQVKQVISLQFSLYV